MTNIQHKDLSNFFLKRSTYHVICNIKQLILWPNGTAGPHKRAVKPEPKVTVC